MKKRFLDIFLVAIIACVTISTVAFIGGGSGRQGSDSPNSDSRRSAELIKACQEGDLDSLKEMIEAGVNLEVQDPIGGSTPLIIACVFNQPEVVTILLEGGANINGKAKDGGTPLHAAAFFGNKDIVRILLNHDPDLNLRNSFFQTPYDSVALPWSAEIEGVYSFLDGILPFKLDFEAIKNARPEIAEILKNHQSTP